MSLDLSPQKVKQEQAAGYNAAPGFSTINHIPTANMGYVQTKPAMPAHFSELAAQMSSPRGQQQPNSPGFIVGPPPDQLLQSTGTIAIQTKHAAELEALLMRQQLEVATLVTNQRLELDALLRGAPLVPQTNGVNIGILQVFNVLSKMQSMLASPAGRQNLTNSDEIDILSVDEQSMDRDPSNWKTTAGGHGTAPVAQPTATAGRGTKRTTKKRDTASPSHASNQAQVVVNPFNQANQRTMMNVNSNESGSEDDGSRRTQRKRVRPSQPGYFVDDREMETILGSGTKKRKLEVVGANTANENFAVPSAPIATTPPAASVPIPYKKPKPRDNVSIATILDIYSPYKSQLSAWKFTKGRKTLIVYHTDCLDHITPEWHLESPNRLKAVMESIELVRERFLNFAEIVSDFEPAQLDLVRSCHHERYITKIMDKIPANRAMPPLHATQDIELSLSMSSSLTRPPTQGEVACEPPKDTYVSYGSWNAALLAAGSVIYAVDRLFEPSGQENKFNRLRNAFCGVRPPGHHAGAHGHDGASTNGYCVLNSVAIGAQHAFKKYGLERIAILDFDVHQGNGTAQIVENDERILFISLHGSEIYPFSEATKAEADKCTNRIINIGYANGTNGKQFIELFISRCKQLLIDFQPQLILLSAGFDAHIDDPTGAAMLRFADYVALTRLVKEIADSPSCQGRIISVLEGGYDIRALKLSVTAHILTLMEGDSSVPQPPLDEPLLFQPTNNSDSNHEQGKGSSHHATEEQELNASKNGDSSSANAPPSANASSTASPSAPLASSTPSSSTPSSSVTDPSALGSSGVASSSVSGSQMEVDIPSEIPSSNDNDASPAASN